MGSGLFCPVEGCESEPVKVLDVRSWVNNTPWPEALVCTEHYSAIMREPTKWKFSTEWDRGLLIQPQPKKVMK